MKGLSLQQKVQSFLDARGWSQIQLSREAGLGDMAVRDILNGRSKSPRRRTLLRLAGAMGLSLDELLDSAPTRTTLATPLDRFALDVPLWASEPAAGGDGFFVKPRATHFVHRLPGLMSFDDAFAVTVQSKEMQPWRATGSWIHCAPGLRLEQGGHCLVLLRSTRDDLWMHAKARQFLGRKDRRLYLRRYWPREEEECLSFEDIQTIMPILDLQDLLTPAGSLTDTS